MHLRRIHTLALATLAWLVSGCFSAEDSPELYSHLAAVGAADHGRDIATELADIPGMTVTEDPDAPVGYRLFRLTYEQPVDHDDPNGLQFTQNMTLVHRGVDAPMVFEPHGYALNFTFLGELTQMLDANQLAVEHRFFGNSRPETEDMSKLNIAQAAADHHRVVAAVRPLYQGAWVSTGASKGGMTAMYHRRFYPDDVDATVAYVAPHSFGRADNRYVRFLEQVGDAACRSKMHAFQREVLLRRDAIVPLALAWSDGFGISFDHLDGGIIQALDIVTAEFWFTFWQYGNASECAQIPATTASDADLFQFVNRDFGLYLASNAGVAAYGSYFYQAVTQLGYPKTPIDHLADVILYDPNEPTIYVPNPPPFDAGAMIDISRWVSAQAEAVMFIYGANDPWSAGAFPVLPWWNPREVRTFVVPAGNHGADIGGLTNATKARALGLLESWTGVIPDPAVLEADSETEVPATREQVFERSLVFQRML